MILLNTILLSSERFQLQLFFNWSNCGADSSQKNVFFSLTGVFSLGDLIDIIISLGNLQSIYLFFFFSVSMED